MIDGENESIRAIYLRVHRIEVVLEERPRVGIWLRIIREHLPSDGIDASCRNQVADKLVAQVLEIRRGHRLRGIKSRIQRGGSGIVDAQRLTVRIDDFTPIAGSLQSGG